MARAAGIDITVPRGFICRGQEELQGAFALLGGNKCVIRVLGAHAMGDEPIVLDDATQMALLEGTRATRRPIILLLFPFTWNSRPPGSIHPDPRSVSMLPRWYVAGVNVDTEMVIEEFVQFDKSQGSTSAPRAFQIPFQGGKVLPDAATDKMMIGLRIAGLRPTNAPKKLIEMAQASDAGMESVGGFPCRHASSELRNIKILEYWIHFFIFFICFSICIFYICAFLVQKIASALVKAFKPTTVGAIHFHSLHGKPVLSGITTGVLDPFHQAEVFLREHGGPDNRYCMWKVRPGADMTGERGEGGEVGGPPESHTEAGVPH